MHFFFKVSFQRENFFAPIIYVSTGWEIRVAPCPVSRDGGSSRGSGSGGGGAGSGGWCR